MNRAEFILTDESVVLRRCLKTSSDGAEVTSESNSFHGFHDHKPEMLACPDCSRTVEGWHYQTVGKR